MERIYSIRTQSLVEIGEHTAAGDEKECCFCCICVSRNNMKSAQLVPKRG